jgi:hypothetical protein
MRAFVLSVLLGLLAAVAMAPAASAAHIVGAHALFLLPPITNLRLT